jgi:hypothetical protein
MIGVGFTLLSFWFLLHDVPQTTTTPPKKKKDAQENLEYFALIVLDIGFNH